MQLSQRPLRQIPAEGAEINATPMASSAETRVA
jgi:hypothetical protein